MRNPDVICNLVLYSSEEKLIIKHASHHNEKLLPYATEAVFISPGLKPFFLFEVPYAAYNNQYAYGNHNGIGKTAVQLGHIYEVHAIPAGNQRKGHEYSSNNSQNTHKTVLLCVERGTLQLTNLNAVLLNGEACNLSISVDKAVNELSKQPGKTMSVTAEKESDYL